MSLIIFGRNMIPEAAKGVNWKYKSKWAYLTRYALWHNWLGQRYGLLFLDSVFEPAPEVQEALRRLNYTEPWLYDERKIRLMRAHNLAMNNDILPKQYWTKWEDETWYLHKYLREIEEEKVHRKNSTNLKPGYEIMKAYHAHH